MLILVGLQIGLELMSITTLSQVRDSVMHIAAEWIAVHGAVIIVAVIIVAVLSQLPFLAACWAVDIVVAA